MGADAVRTLKSYADELSRLLAEAAAIGYLLHAEDGYWDEEESGPPPLGLGKELVSLIDSNGNGETVTIP